MSQEKLHKHVKVPKPCKSSTTTDNFNNTEKVP